jgi:hypothetical protein
MTVATGTATTLLGGVTITANTQFTVALDPDTTSEEIVFITAGPSGDTFTISRGEAGTAAVSHSTGATVKHVLTSSDLTSFETGTATANAAIPKSTVTTKGDLIVATASSTVTRVAVGANNTVLTADSAVASGVKWASPDLSMTISAKTNNYTLVVTDINKLITMTSSSATAITVPNGVFTTGQQINVASLGTGITTIASDGTTVVDGTPGLNLRAQYSTATIICTATNTFLVAGDLSV